jgi:hypothetical protein
MLARVNQPFRVEDEGPMGCKLLLDGDKMILLRVTEGTIRIRTG